ncbi:MAG: hypothetical protein WCJ74_02255 [bacterium]
MMGSISIAIGTNVHRISCSWRDLNVQDEQNGILQGKSLLTREPTCKAQERDLLNNGWKKYSYSHPELVTS